MSFITVNGRQVETLSVDVDLFEPKPVSPNYKYKKNTLFADNSGNIRFTVQEEERKEESSILGKRKACDAFGEKYGGDYERYEGFIDDNYFKDNMGHGSVSEATNGVKNEMVGEAKGESSNLFNGHTSEELMEWCFKYLASKGISINN